MKQNSLFIDTWGWLVIGHRRESQHLKVKEYYRELRKSGVSIYTSDYVIDELITILFKREIYSEAVQFLEGIFTAIKWHQLLLINVDTDIFTKAWKLRKKFQDKPNISFTDLTSMTIMREFKIKMILTDDDHFLHVGMGFIKTI